jgi:ABC-type Mn2+/Zn2+ transport system permease subunit
MVLYDLSTVVLLKKWAMLGGQLTHAMTVKITGSYTITDPVVHKAMKYHLKQFYCEWL